MSLKSSVARARNHGKSFMKLNDTTFGESSTRINTMLEYNIIFPAIEKTERKSCCIREQIIDIVMVSERDFDNVTCVLSCNV